MSTPTIEPCRDGDQLRTYIDRHWRAGHVLARDDAMFRFCYMTPWVDPAIFPGGISALCIYGADGDLKGFVGAICAPYPAPRSFWWSLWHVLPELKGSGLGMQVLRESEAIALGRPDQGTTAHDGWIGTFNPGAEAIPLHLRNGAITRAVRHWVYEPTAEEWELEPHPEPREVAPSSAWIDYRYRRHPRFDYEITEHATFRTDENDWGVVVHAVRLLPGWSEDVRRMWDEGRRLAGTRRFMLDAWSYERPGAGWTLSGDDTPTVFHPPEPRGNLAYLIGKPFLPAAIHRGDGDQDRPV